MHTLCFLDPGHFHAALTLREASPRVADEIYVYAPEGPELRAFLGLVDRFNCRPERPTRWRPVVRLGDDPVGRFLVERPGDAVALAGRNGGKAHAIRRLHDAGLHVLADKPWLVEPGDLADIRAGLSGWPLAMEIMTGRHDGAAEVARRLAGDPGVLGALPDDGAPSIEQTSVHYLDKRVDGAPLRRPAWFFDVRVQGEGVVDIPTHLVDQVQWLLEDRGGPPGETPQLVAARGWSTRVPVDAFSRITGEPAFPPALAPWVENGALAYRCNAELAYRLAGVTVRANTRWDLAPPPGGSDTHALIVRGDRAEVRLEQGPHTGHRRRVQVVPRPGGPGVEGALRDALARWQSDLPGVGAAPMGEVGGYEMSVPTARQGGHESHFPLVLEDFLAAIDEGHWLAARAERTAAKYALLAAAAAAVH